MLLLLINLIVHLHTTIYLILIILLLTIGDNLFFQQVTSGHDKVSLVNFLLIIWWTFFFSSPPLVHPKAIISHPRESIITPNANTNVDLMFSDTSHGETSIPHHDLSSSKENYFFIDHGNGAVSSVRQTLPSLSDRPSPFTSLPFSPHVTNYPESTIDTIKASSLLLNRQSASKPPPARINTRAFNSDRLPSSLTDSLGPESGPQKLHNQINFNNGYQNGVNFFSPLTAPPTSRRESINDADPYLAAPLSTSSMKSDSNYVNNNQVNLDQELTSANVNRNHDLAEYRNQINSNIELPSDSIESGEDEQAPPSSEVINSNDYLINDFARDRRIRKQAPDYNPQGQPLNGNLFDSPLIGSNIGADFLPNFADPSNGQSSFPFLDGPFMPLSGGPVNHNQPDSQINGFQRRRLSVNSINDNSLGYGYPSYTYYKGEDEAATKWPKIFKFTDGRVNLSDFERNKKIGKVKFKESSDWNDIRRDSFLILHGGSYNY